MGVQMTAINITGGVTLQGPAGTATPVANFTATPTSGNTPLSVSFTDTSTGSPTSWSWDFGDGNTSTSQNPTHIYSTGGTFTVALTATNAGGSNTKTSTNYITATTPAPVANFTASPTSGGTPLSVAFTDTSTNTPTSWLWDFGDGSTSTAQNPTHIYSTGGTFTVALTATNAGGSNTKTVTDEISVTYADSLFNYNSLLLNAESSSTTTTNNTFVDSSSNNFTITPLGTPTQGTFTPFDQNNWGTYFNGTTDYVSAPANAAFTIGTDNFTIECWVYPMAYGGAVVGASLFQANSGTQNGFSLNLGESQTRCRFISRGTGAWADNVVAATGPALNTWSHVAVVRNGTSLTIYVNGTQQGTTTISAGFSLSGATTASTMGYFSDGGTTRFLNGYLSNVRVVKGTAVYTSNFTPSTTPLTAISGTSLLALNSSRFVDTSSNNFAITATGTPSVQANSPFNPTSAWSASTNGGSVYLNGTTDYLTTPANAAFTLGTGDFTVESWVYLTNAATSAYIASMNYEGSGGTGQWALYMTGASATKQLWFNSSSGNNMASATVSMPANTWMHVAYSRSGTSGRFFVNGTQVGTTLTDSKNYPTSTGTFYVGRMSTAANYLPGYISNLRVVKGTAVYTANFTPSTTPLTAIANTSLLLSATNGAINDASGKNAVITVGGAGTSTTVVKYGTSSIKFNGTTDYLALPLTTTMQLGSGNFTYETWIYSNAIGARQNFAFINGNTSGFAALSINILANGKLACAASETGSTWKFEDVTGIGTALSANTWYYVAVVRNGATITVYLNGTSIGTYSLTSATTSLMTTYTLNQIGVYNTNNYRMNGYIDDLRITKGVARYTTNFTAPAAAFPVQ